MSEETKTSTEETKQDAGFSIKLVDNIEDQEVKDQMKALINSNKALADSNKEMRDIITKQETERELIKYDKQRAEKLEELSKWPHIAKKHEKTKDLGTLQTAIDTANDMESTEDFTEYEKNKDKDKDKTKNYVVPKTYT